MLMGMKKRKKSIRWHDYAPTLFAMVDEAEAEARHAAYLRAHQRAMTYLAEHPKLAGYEEMLCYSPAMDEREPGLLALLDDVGAFGIPYPPNIPVRLYGKMIVEELESISPVDREDRTAKPINRLISYLFKRRKRHGR
jgi:hypothetical protein